MKNIFKILVLLVLLIIGVLSIRVLTRGEEVQGNITFNFDALSQYESLYVGDMSNTSQLFGDLLLSEKNKSFRLYPELLKVTMYFDEEIESTDDKLIRKAVVYNSLIAFSIIKNLEIIEYEFNYESYVINRSDAELWVDFKLDDFHKSKINTDVLMSKINNESFIESSLKTLKNDTDEEIIDENVNEDTIEDEAYYPLIIGNYIVGIYNNDQWTKASESLEEIMDIKSYNVYDSSGFLGEGNLDELINHSDEYTRVNLLLNDQSIETDYLASNAEWDLMPRLSNMQSLTSDTYKDIVKDVLVENGIIDEVEIIITQNIKIDLEGDGIDEVIIVAENLDYKNTYLSNNDYSMIFIRKIIDGNVEHLYLVNDFVPSNTASKENITINHKILNIIDSDGDGILELIMVSESMDGKAYTLYKLIDNKFVEQLNFFIGLTVIFN